MATACRSIASATTQLVGQRIGLLPGPLLHLGLRLGLRNITSIKESLFGEVRGTLTSFFSAWARRLASVLAISSIMEAMPLELRPMVP